MSDSRKLLFSILYVCVIYQSNSFFVWLFLLTDRKQDDDKNYIMDDQNKRDNKQSYIS